MTYAIVLLVLTVAALAVWCALIVVASRAPRLRVPDSARRDHPEIVYRWEHVR